MRPRMILGIFVLCVALSLTGCAGPNKELISKQRDGISYPVPYQKAFQTVLFTLTKKGIAVNTIDKEHGLITTFPQQAREERYIYQIAIRPTGSSETSITVMCNWSVSPGADVVFVGIPSAVAASKSKDLELELADDIGKEMARAPVK